MQRLAYSLISWLPFPLLYACAWIAYVLVYYVARYRRAVVKDNLRRAFPEKSETELKALGKKFYRHLTVVAFEIVRARRMTPADFRERVIVRNPELVNKYSNDLTRSVIVLTIHQGNWEWMLHGATTALKIPIDPVYKPLHNPVANDLIHEIRSQFGSRPLAMAHATRDILKRRSEFRLFVMVADQGPTRHERTYWTTFLNQESAFFMGAESIAKLTQFPVLFAQCHRMRTGHYEIEFHEMAEPPYEKESHEIIQRYVELTQQCIRAEPESWLWSNRRWKRNRRAEEAEA
ncbi:MAG: lysophospholipid acyltransferase family protein [Halioglobus sp.]